MGDDQGGGHGQRAPCHAAPLEADAPAAHAVEQQAAEEGVEQSADANVNLVRGEAEAAYNGVFGILTHGEQPRHVEVKRQVDGQEGGEGDEHRQHQAAEAAHKEGVEDVGHILPHQ